MSFGMRLLPISTSRSRPASRRCSPASRAGIITATGLRLPGRHHSRPALYSCWNDEPFAESQWLAGHDAIDRMLATRPAPPAVLEKIGITRLRRPFVSISTAYCIRTNRVGAAPK